MKRRRNGNIKERAGRLFELQAGTSRLLPMEGMRGLSAFLVFFVHFYALFGSRALEAPVKSTFLFLATLGHCGVDVFFALSGYIMYGLLMEKPFHYGTFLRRRIARLYPAFGAVFALYLAIDLVDRVRPLGHGFLPAAGYLLANFLMLPGIFPVVPLISVAWSLSYELCFYVTLPLLIWALRLKAWPRRVRVALVLGVCAAQLALTSAGLLGHPRLIMFGCGILMREAACLKPRWVPAGSVLAAGAFLGALCANALSGNPEWAVYCGPVLIFHGAGLAYLFLATLALGHFTLTGGGFLASWFRWDWIRWFGNISYSYYLIHGFALHVLKSLLEYWGLPARLPAAAFVCLCVAAFAVTLAAGAALFLAVEKQFSFHRGAKSEPAPALASRFLPFRLAPAAQRRGTRPSAGRRRAHSSEDASNPRYN